MANYIDLCGDLDKHGFMSNAIGMCQREVRAVRQKEKSRVDRFLTESKTFQAFQTRRALATQFILTSAIPGFLRWTHDLKTGTQYRPFPVFVDRKTGIIRQQESLHYGILADVIDCLFYRDKTGSEHHWGASGPAVAADAVAATQSEIEAASAVHSSAGSMANRGRRIGQDKFREKILKKRGACEVTGCRHPGLLKASHIHAWTLSTTSQKHDEHNGLLLAAHVDAAFEIGLISFSDDGSMLFSAEFSSADRAALGLGKTHRLQGLSNETRSYLERHRERHGFGS